MAKGIKFKDMRSTAGMAPLDIIAKLGKTGAYAPDKPLDAAVPREKATLDRLKNDPARDDATVANWRSRGVPEATIADYLKKKKAAQ